MDKVKVRGKEPYFFEDEAYEIVRRFRAPDLFDPSGNDADFVLVKNALGVETELHADSVEYV